MNDLYRLVTEQSGHVHISNVILTWDEAYEALATDILMHTLTGWDVRLLFAERILDEIATCQRGGTVRTLSFVTASPMEEVTL